MAISNNNIKELDTFMTNYEFKSKGAETKYNRIYNAFKTQDTIDMIIGKSVVFKLDNIKHKVIMKYDDIFDGIKNTKSIFCLNEKVIEPIEEEPIEEEPIEEPIEEEVVDEEPEEPEEPIVVVKPQKLTKEEKLALKEQKKIEAIAKALKEQKEREDKRHEHYLKQKELMFNANPSMKEDYRPRGHMYKGDMATEISCINYTLDKYNMNEKNDVYDNKKYTLFMTEEELDCIKEGLELLQKQRELKGAEVPCYESRCKNTLGMITERLSKLKNKVVSGKIKTNNTSMKWGVSDDY